MAAQTLAAAATMRDSVSATTFDVPGTYTSWFVLRYERQVSLRGPEVAEILLMGKIKGFARAI